MLASWNGDVDEEICSCLFVNDSNAQFGGLKRAVCLDAELQKDLQSVVFYLSLWLVLVSFFADFSSIFPVIIASLVIVLRKNSASANDSGVIFSV